MTKKGLRMITKKGDHFFRKKIGWVTPSVTTPGETNVSDAMKL